MSYGVCVVRQAPVICVMAPPIHLGAWSMALMICLPFELLLLLLALMLTVIERSIHRTKEPSSELTTVTVL